MVFELASRGISTQSKITKAFGDSPNGNDSGILALAEKGYVIASKNNAETDKYPYERITWDTFLTLEGLKHLATS